MIADAPALKHTFPCTPATWRRQFRVDGRKQLPSARQRISLHRSAADSPDGPSMDTNLDTRRCSATGALAPDRRCRGCPTSCATTSTSSSSAPPRAALGASRRLLRAPRKLFLAHALAGRPDAAPLRPARFRQAARCRHRLHRSVEVRLRHGPRDRRRRVRRRRASTPRCGSYQPRAIAFTSKKAASLWLRRRTDRIAYGRQKRRPADFCEVFVLPSPSSAARRYWKIEPWRDLADWLRATQALALLNATLSSRARRRCEPRAEFRPP